jgi:hypothetical protein
MSNSQKLADMLIEEDFQYLRPPIEPFGTLQWIGASEIQQVGKTYGEKALTVVETTWQETQPERPQRFKPRRQTAGDIFPQRTQSGNFESGDEE